jgi:hypothetical protein
MNAYTISVRTQDAYQRIIAAAKQIAPRYAAVGDQLKALEEVKDKDPQAESVKRLESIAGLLESIVPYTAAMQVGYDASIGTPAPIQAPTPVTEPTTRKGKR